MARCGSAIALAAACAASLGCGGTDRASAFAVWSDDQSEALVVINRWTEGNPAYMGIRRIEDERFEVRTYTTGGTRLRTLEGETTGAAGPAWYMRTQGYALLVQLGGDCCEANRPYTVEQIASDRPTRVLSQGTPVSWLPSPDGALLARATLSAECPLYPPTACTYDLLFVDAVTLDPVADPVTVQSSIDGRHYVFWTPSGDFYMYAESAAFPSGFSSVLVTPGSAPRPVDPLPCTQETPRPSVLPGTSSDYVSRDGRTLRASVDDDNVTLTVEDTGMPGWPGRCFP